MAERGTGTVRLQSARPNLEVRDVAASISFYEEVLGLTVQASMGDPPSFAILGRDGAELGLVAGDNPAVARAAACYMTVIGVGALHDRCVRMGVRITSPLTRHPWGMEDFVVRDPDGHQVAIGERVGP